MTTTSTTPHCPLLAASAIAYDVGRRGAFTPSPRWLDLAGFTGSPAVVAGGIADLDAALVGTTPDGVVVAFRGTVPPSKSLESVLDWAQDLFLAEPTACSGFPGKVHAGFHRAWTRLERGIVDAVAARWKPGMELHVTGHSKGGSLASLGAWGLRSAGFTPTHVTTFAAAHVGDQAFARAYDSVFTQIRYENHLDLVPFLPPTPALGAPFTKVPLLKRLFREEATWDYAKVGQLRYVTDGGRVVGDEPGLDELRIAQIVNAVTADHGDDVGAAHSLVGPGGYCRGICPEGTCGSDEPSA